MLYQVILNPLSGSLRGLDILAQGFTTRDHMTQRTVTNHVLTKIAYLGNVMNVVNVWSNVAQFYINVQRTSAFTKNSRSVLLTTPLTNQKLVRLTNLSLKVRKLVIRTKMIEPRIVNQLVRQTNLCIFDVRLNSQCNSIMIVTLMSITAQSY